MPATNQFASFARGPESPALSLTAITPNDGTDLPAVVRQIYAGVGGNIALIDSYGNTVTFVGVGQGATIGPFQVARVLSTGTTASSLIGYV